MLGPDVWGVYLSLSTNNKEPLSGPHVLQDKKAMRVNQVIGLKLDRGPLRLLSLPPFVFHEKQMFTCWIITGKRGDRLTSQ